MKYIFDVFLFYLFFVFLSELWQLPDEVDEVAPKLPSSGNWGVLVQAKAEPGDNKYPEHLATDHPLYLWVALQRNLQNNFFSSKRDEKPICQAPKRSQ